MIKLDKDHQIVGNQYKYIRTKDNHDKVLVFERGDILFVFNWHPSNSFNNYPIYVKSCQKAQVLWSSDDSQFGGHSRVGHMVYDVESIDAFCGRFHMYLPNRTATVFKIVYKE